MSLEGTLLSAMSAASRLTPRLILQIDLENRSNKLISILGITGEMFLKKGDGFSGFASLNTILTGTVIEPNTRRNFALELDLSFHHIEIIEEARIGGDVHFRLNLKILYVIHTAQRSIDHFDYTGVSVRMPISGDILKIHQSEWVKMLAEMGYERLRVIELPIPEPPKGTVIDSSLRHVEEALRSFNEGDYDDVLGNCRKAIEDIEHAKLDLKSLLESESKAEKMDEISKKVKDYLNLGPHIGVEIDRKDAEAALYLTLSITRYLAKKIYKKS